MSAAVFNHTQFSQADNSSRYGADNCAPSTFLTATAAILHWPRSLSSRLMRDTNEAMTFRYVRRYMATAALACALLPAGSLRAQSQLPVMPLPAHVVEGTGSLSINGGLQVVFEGHTEPRLERARDRFLAHLAGETGILPVPAAPGVQPRFIIKT